MLFALIIIMQDAGIQSAQSTRTRSAPSSHAGPSGPSSHASPWALWSWSTKGLSTRILSGLHHRRQLLLETRALCLTCIAVRKRDDEEGQASFNTTPPLPSARPELGMQLWPRPCQGRQELGEASHQEGFPIASFRSSSLTFTSVVIRAFIWQVFACHMLCTGLEPN